MKIFEHKTILVADDDPGNRELVVSTLHGLAEGIKVLSASNGGQALEILAKRNVDAMLLDWEMPVKDGYAVLCEMKANDEWKDIPVLMYTGVMTSTGNLVKALEIGAADFIRKPTEPVELMARIKSVLKQREDFNERMRLEKETAEMRSLVLKTEITSLKEQLNNYLIQLARKNEMLINLRDRLNEGESSASAAKHIDSLVSMESYWDELFQQFSRLDKHFFVSLNKKHDELSPNELKFCVLIKAGMGSKEIASLMNVSGAAIEKSRYRIRKKLALSPEESLEKYIISF
ncbi:MAG: response regulator [Bacteroidota bacterium]|nr:response regulator [Bacteroidota bacterium]